MSLSEAVVTPIARTIRSLDRLPLAMRDLDGHRRARLRRSTLALRLRAMALGGVVRRVIDVVATGLGLLFLAPVFALAAIAIRATSKGAVFYTQERIGERGVPFKLYKLRTMYVGADALKSKLAAAHAHATDGVRFKLRVDPRVTRVGRILRKLSIDELPQLWNVFKGDMTLVGPRPPVWREVAQYDARALRRLEVRPGLTCLWQIGGRSDLSFDEQVALDVEYIDNVRPSQELAIVLKTIPAVLSGRGAY
jgi:lipopolysaccharide/colanic/teichoic acid biosynthesis glycosyltransferase